MLSGLSLSKKLRYTMMLTACAALFLITILNTLNESLSSGKAIEHKLLTLASVIGTNSAASLLFLDKKFAHELLRGLNAEPTVLWAEIRDTNSNQFAIYQKDQVLYDDTMIFPPSSEESYVSFSLKQIIAGNPIVFDGERLGYILIASDLSSFKASLRRNLLVSALILLLTIIFVYWLSSVLQKKISSPIIHLGKVMKSISATKNVKRRVQKIDDDEIGQLYDHFNSLLLQIQKREHDLAMGRSRLEHKVAQRTWELTRSNVLLLEANRKANEAKEVALAATKAKSQFLANMSHEIRTPMNGVLGMLELLENTHLDEQQKDYTTIANRSANVLLYVINDILDFSKIESGKMELEFIVVDLREIINEVCLLLSPKAYEKGIEFLSFIPEEVPRFVMSDPTRLRQILINLLDNAIKFTEHGKIVISLSSEQKNKELARVKFSVEDTGIGITEDKIAVLFQPFSQVDDSSARRFGGTGLGLSISKRLVDLMHGEMHVKSELGSGSTFFFIFEMKKVTSRESEKRDLSHINARVLIVDDNETNRAILRYYLKSLGVKSEEAKDGEEAWKLCEDSIRSNTPYDAMLIDFHMPGMDGISLSEKIMLNPELSHTPRILLSSGAPQNKADLLKKGFVDFTRKPCQQEHIYNVLKKILDRDSPEDKTSQPVKFTLATADLNYSEYQFLLVEDNAVNQKVAEGMFSRFGIDVDIAENGKLALKEFSNYDLIFMDCQVPVMSGYEATQKIREQESQSKKKRCIIIAMTANAMEGDREKCLSFGMDDYIKKPFRMDELKIKIDTWIDFLNERKKQGKHPERSA